MLICGPPLPSLSRRSAQPTIDNSGPLPTKILFLHSANTAARPAAAGHLEAENVVIELGERAGVAQSEVLFYSDSRVANGKSILDLVTLGAICGARLTIETSGPDAEIASAELCALIGEPLHKK